MAPNLFILSGYNATHWTAQLGVTDADALGATTNYADNRVSGYMNCLVVGPTDDVVYSGDSIGYVYKYVISTTTQTYISTLGGTGISSIVIDKAGGYLYAADTSAKIFKISLSTFTLTATLTTAAGPRQLILSPDGLTLWWVDGTNNYAYSTTIASFSTITSYSIGVSDLRSIAVDSTNTYAYIGSYANAEIIRLTISGGATTTLSMLNSVTSVAIDTTNAWLLVSLNATLSNFQQVNLSTFAVGVTTTVGNGSSTFCIADPRGGYFYAYGSGSAKALSKLAMSSLSVAVTFTPSTYQSPSAAAFGNLPSSVLPRILMVLQAVKRASFR